MKLNDFVKKPSTSRKASPQFVLKNDAELLKYQEEVADLNNQLGYYRRIEAERDDAMRQLNAVKENMSDRQKVSDQVSEKLIEVEKTVEYQEQQLTQIPILEEKVRTATGQYSQANNEFQNITKTAFEQSTTLASLGTQVEVLKSENEDLSKETKQARADKISAVEEVLTFQNENEELKNFTVNTSKINKGLKTELKESKDRAVFWETESREVSVQLKESGVVEDKLRKWVTNLEMQESQATFSKGELNQELTSSQSTVTEMGTVIEDLIKEMTYLRAINKGYRKELSKPKFMSMGAIARKEGFVMPNGKENLRTHYLGNSAPTLLKFKAGEEISYAR